MFIWIAYVTDEQNKVIRFSSFGEESEMKKAVEEYNKKFGVLNVHWLCSKLGAFHA